MPQQEDDVQGPVQGEAERVREVAHAEQVLVCTRARLWGALTRVQPHAVLGEDVGRTRGRCVPAGTPCSVSK